MSTTATRSPVTSAGIRGAVLAAVALTAAGVAAVLSPWPYPGPEGSWAWVTIESADVVGEVGIVVALGAVHALQRTRSGSLGRIGFWLSASGAALFAVSTAMWLMPLTDGILLDVLFNGALLGWLLGLPLLGAGTLRAGVLPRWCGWLIVAYGPLFLTAFLLVDTSSWARLAIGLPWLGVARALAITGSSRPVVGTGRVAA